MNQLRLAIICIMGVATSATILTGSAFAQTPTPASAAPTNEVNCDDGADDDSDGYTDCDDGDCSNDVLCPPRKVSKEICDDGVDNDLDGQIDCGDLADCKNATDCRDEVCNNGIDDDADGYIDCTDNECMGSNLCKEVGHCLDGVDNDGNGAIDCNDTDCTASVECTEADKAEKKAQALAEERKHRPYKVAAAQKSLSEAQKAEVNARSVLAKDPTNKNAQANLGKAVADQLRLRGELIGLGQGSIVITRPYAKKRTYVSPAAAEPGNAARRVNFTAP